MITYEQDPDVVRWGLQLFDGDPYSNCGFCDSISQQHNIDCYPGHYLKGYQYGGDSNYAVGNDLNINNLHEELSRLSMIEPVKSFQEGPGNQQTSFCPQDWFPQSLGNFRNRNENEEEAELGVSGSCSSPGDKSYSGGEWSYSLELMDGHAFDGEVGKRLNQMVPIPHIPKINGEIPSIDEATLDHQRLLNRLQVYELVEFKVQGDGNCQFRALSDQFYCTPEHHKFVRQQIVEQYGMKIFVITSFKDTCYIEILPNVQKSERVIFLSFWAEVHYNSIYPERDCPTFRTKKKKRWQASQHEHVELPDGYN